MSFVPSASFKLMPPKKYRRLPSRENERPPNRQRWAPPKVEAVTSRSVRVAQLSLDSIETTFIRPDGKETFVQGGWVRGNERKLDRAKSTRLEPVLSLREGDFESA